MIPKKKLIEVALPLEAINREALQRKQKAPKGWPTSFHKWWAQRPLAACRAVIFAQLVDDPSENPSRFPTVGEQESERQRLFKIIEQLVLWDNTDNEDLISAVRKEILDSWQATCESASEDECVKAFYDPLNMPPVCDPFAGSGSIPISAQWMRLRAIGRDLNPVAVLINKTMVEIPPIFKGMAPVNSRASSDKKLLQREWRGAAGLAEDTLHYAQWMREEADNRIGRYYRAPQIDAALAASRPDLAPFVGRSLTPVAWIWARTVRSPNPAFADVYVPVSQSFVLSSKEGRQTYVQPLVSGQSYQFEVVVGQPRDPAAVARGTSAGKWNGFRCLMSGEPISYEYIRQEALAGRMKRRLMATVVDCDRTRIYLPPTQDAERLAEEVPESWAPDLPINYHPRDIKTQIYGLMTYGDLFSPRQLLGLNTFCDLALEVRERVRMDAIRNGLSDDGVTLSEGGRGARAYADAVVIYLACVIDRMAYYGSTLTTWLPKDNALRDCMPRQALAMSWDYAEANPLGKSSGDILTCAKAVASYLSVASTAVPGIALQADAQMMTGELCIYSTDPPYFDNIGYADLSDYFYVWLRRTLGPVLPELFSTIAVPKAEELVASPYRHGGAQLAERFFLDGMTRAMRVLYAQAHPAFPITIYYAFKQSESDENDGTVSTGWETFLEAVIGAGLSVTGTWPLRTEGAGRLIAKGANALASSIVLVCRKRPLDAPIATRREFAKVLRSELPAALGHLQRGNIAPVDIAQASIGPGMAVYSRYSKVVDAAGARLTVRDALAMINQSLDEILAEQEGDFDADSRWALAWFEQYGFGEGDFGVAETLSKAKNTSVNGLVDAGVLASKRGKVRLLSPGELPDDWDPASDERLTTWEMVHHLVRVLEANSEPGAAALAAKLGSNAEVARELCYRLYTICERKKRAAEALSYNSLVQSWPEIMRLARESPAVTAGAVPAPPEAPQTTLFEDGAKPKKKRTKGKN